MNFHDHEPVANLELSREALRELFDEIAKALVVRGKITPEYTGLVPAEQGGALPVGFKYTLPPDVVRDLFYAHDEEVIAKAGEVLYLAPHRLEEDDIETLEMVSIEYPGRLQGTEVEQRKWMTITREGSDYRAYTDTEYTSDGQQISPNDIGVSTTLDEERIAQIIDDKFALEQPFTLDDAERAREVLKYIAATSA